MSRDSRLLPRSANCPYSACVVPSDLVPRIMSSSPGLAKRVMNCPSCQQLLIDSPDLAGQTVACPHCGHTFALPGQPEIPSPVGGESVAVSKAYTQNRKNNQARNSVIVIAVVGALLFIFFLVAISVQAPERARNFESEAINEARSLVSEFLKRPTKISFASLKTQRLGVRCFAVRGVVTTKKGQSSQRKTPFSCTVSFWTSEDEWKCVKLRLGNDVVVDKPKNRARYAKEPR